jgi:hypothetical protein
MQTKVSLLSKGCSKEVFHDEFSARGETSPRSPLGEAEGSGGRLISINFNVV